MTFSLKTIEGGKIHYRESESSTWNTEYSEHRKYIKISGNGKTTSYENTVEKTQYQVYWFMNGMDMVLNTSQMNTIIIQKRMNMFRKAHFGIKRLINIRNLY